MTPDPPPEADHLTQGAVTRRPCWLGNPEAPFAAWLHHPTDRNVRPNGVVLCPSFGFEYSHAHRTLLHLADLLADAGFAALRMDYPGTGDSGGDEETANLVEVWLDSVAAGLAFVERLTGGAPASVIGLRLGALLGGVVATRRPIHGYVAWAPVLRGRRFVREVRALHKVATQNRSLVTGFLDSGGFRISDATAARLSGLDLSGSVPDARGGVLLVDRLDQPLGSCPPWASVESGATHVTQADYFDMMAEPQYTVVPIDTIGRIAGWLSAITPDERVGIDARLLDEVRSTRSRRLAVDGGPGVVEELCLLPTESAELLYGVLSTPAGTSGDGRVVLLPNSGSVHHVGPNRFHVELARALAVAGMPSLRFDLRNLGDSGGVPGPVENHPYPSTAVEDVRHALRWLTNERGYESTVLMGLCSGAHTAFHSGFELHDDPISEIVGINPLTFYYTDGMSLDTPSSLQTASDAQYYGRAMRDFARWKRIFSGESALGHIALFVVRHFRQLLADGVQLSLRRLHLRGPARLERDLVTTTSLGRPVHFVFSSTDPGHELLMRDARLTIKRLEREGMLTRSIIPDADHTFSRYEHRRAVIDVLVDRLLPSTPELVRRELPTGPDLWPALRPAWTSLVEATDERSAFLSATWMAAWLERFAGRVGARGFVWSKEADNPVGCAVLSTQKGKTGPFTVTRTFLNASGVPGVGCEHNDVLALSEHRNAVIQDMARLIDTFETDEVELAGTRPRLLLELLPLLGGGLPWNGYESESPYVVLQEVRDSGGDYLATLSSNARAQIRRSLRQYERIFGAVELSVATTSDTALEWFGQMLEMHDRRWSAEPSGFPADARRLHADLIRENLDARAARGLRTDVLRIRFGTKTIAILYNLVFQGRVHFFQSGLSYYDDRKLKPGLVAHALAIQHYVDVGEHEYDFLGGDPAPVRYKRSMSSHRRPLVWASISVPTPKSKLINRLRLIWRRVRGIQAD